MDTEKRTLRREGTGTDVVFEIAGEAFSGRMTDLTRAGCRIAAPLPDGAGGTVVVTLLDGVAAEGTIAWQDGTGMGVVFARPLGEATVRYFARAGEALDVRFDPIDSFGRTLPPLPYAARRPLPE